MTMSSRNADNSSSVMMALFCATMLIYLSDHPVKSQ
jgi:hypothetical protein